MMKKLLIILVIPLNLTLYGTTYYVSTTGNDSNAGTIANPWLTWQKGFNSITAGDILYIRGGTYTNMLGAYSGDYYGARASNRDGTASNPIKVLAYPGETPVLDCSGLTPFASYHYGIKLNSCDYWYFKGLTVKNVKEYSTGGKYYYPVAGWEFGGCTQITLEGCVVTGCGNGFTLTATVVGIYYINCDSYLNYDYFDSGGLANGFNGNVSAGSRVFYSGCRSWSNSDDGYDNYKGGGYLSYENCWAFRNGYDVPIQGNGDGFKLGYSTKGDEDGAQRTLKNCISAFNRLMGFDESMNDVTSMDMALYNCIAYSNSNDYGFRFSEPTGTGVTTLRNNISYLNRSGDNYEGRSRNVSDHNSWDPGAPTVTNSDFASIDWRELLRPRKSDGSLPDINFLKLVTGSDMIDKGVNVGIPYSGNAPDLGAFEMQTNSPPAIPVFISSVVENATPSILEMTYDLNLNDLIFPSASSFNVLVNSQSRTVNSVQISGNKVRLTLATAAKFGDIITVSYTKPASNPLQTPSGGEAESISSKPVTNNCKDPTIPNNPPIVLVENEPECFSGFVGELDATGTYDPDEDELTYEWTIPKNVSVSSTTDPMIKFLSPIVKTSQIIEFQLKVSDGKDTVSENIPVNIMPYKPELDLVRISNIEASSFQNFDYPKNVSDGNYTTNWSVVGDNQWLLLRLAVSFKISHLEIAFLKGQRYYSYFDIYASKDNLEWIPVLLKTATCNFSGDAQMFDFPLLMINNGYSYLKFIGHGNTFDYLNNISEFKIFGMFESISGPDNNEEDNIVIYPNPALDFFYISIEEPLFDPDTVRLIDFAGKIVLEDTFEHGIKNVQIPAYLHSGIYIVELRSGNVTLHAQKLLVIK